jgi:hypothetical protein
LFSAELETLIRSQGSGKDTEELDKLMDVLRKEKEDIQKVTKMPLQF